MDRRGRRSLQCVKIAHIYLAVRRWETLTIIIYFVGTGVLDGPNTNDFNQSIDITFSPINRNLFKTQPFNIQKTKKIEKFSFF